MKKLLVLFSFLALLGSSAAGAAEDATVEEQMSGLEAMCEETADARAARQAAESLYDRLGGYDRILVMTKEVVRRHQANPNIQAMFAHVDAGQLARHVADFVASGTGGDIEYTGRDLPSSHRSLELTDADFLSAGGDIIAAMQSLGHGQEEIDEIVCILVSLKGQVVF